MVARDASDERDPPAPETGPAKNGEDVAASWELVLASLEAQGFEVHGSHLGLGLVQDKDALRRLHGAAVAHKVEASRAGLYRHQAALVERLAQTDEVHVKEIRPKLIEVQPRSLDELLFRFCALHWSVPVSSGYGRRLRFLVIDEQNNKLIGLIGLNDPVYALGDRDHWIGWDSDTRKRNLRSVMDAYVLGAVPPYDTLLGGKLVAMLLRSCEVSDSFRRKYHDRVSRIAGTRFDAELALITTASALGRSSVYNRLTFRDRPLMFHLGWTKGYGEFQFLNGAYAVMKKVATELGVCAERHASWGSGFRNRREVVKAYLSIVGKPDRYRMHSVKRELFGVPLGANAQRYLRGDDERLESNLVATSELGESFRQRWLTGRESRLERAADWRREDYRLWN